MTFLDVALALIGVGLGGVVKGALGAGAPIVAIPVLSILFNVPFAVAIMSVPNLMSNIWQGWRFRARLLAPRFVISFALSEALGAVVGTFLLANLPERPLMLILGVIVLAYLAFRLARPDWKISQQLADRLVIPAGTIGGILQGAAGISAPVSITFMNAMKLERPVFIATISVFFVAMSAVQIPALWSLNIMGAAQFQLSLAALFPLWLGMLAGSWAARHVSALVFDRLILGLLAVVAVRLIWSGTLGG